VIVAERTGRRPPPDDGRREIGEDATMKRAWLGMLVILVVAWGNLAAARGLDPLIHDLTTGDESARVRAVVALGRSGDPQAVEVLRQALHDDSALVRQHALRALKELLLALVQTSRLVTAWLNDLLARLEERLEEPPVTTVTGPIDPPPAALAGGQPPSAGRPRWR
jgi:hypothetical protein